MPIYQVDVVEQRVYTVFVNGKDKNDARDNAAARVRQGIKNVVFASSKLIEPEDWYARMEPRALLTPPEPE